MRRTTLHPVLNGPGFWERVAKVFKRSIGAGFTLSRWTHWLDGFWGPSSAGVYVDHDTAMSIAAVYGAVRIIAETIGSLPLILYQRMPDGSKREATEHPLYWLLKFPNDESTQMHFMQTLGGHGALRGNAYAHLIRDGKGRVKEMWPLHPDRVIVMRKNGVLVYQVQPDEITGQSADYVVYNTGKPTMYLFGDEILHFRLMSVNGVTGLSPLQFARNNFGTALAQEEYSARLFSNGATPRGVLKTSEDMNDEEFEDLKEQWKSLHTGVWNAHKTAILPKGVAWEPLSMTSEDAQSLLSRKFQIAEIARVFRVPLHLLQDLDRSTNNNIEQQSLEFVIHTMRPWMVNWEQAYAAQVLTDLDRKKGFFVEFNHEALLRGDLKTESAADNTYIMNGVYSVNEVRAKKGLNPVEGGDEHYVGLNMGAIGNQQPLTNINEPSTKPDGDNPDDLGNQPDTTGNDDGSAKKDKKKTSKQLKNGLTIVTERAKNGFKLLLLREIKLVQAKETAAIRKEARKRSKAEFEQWLDKFGEDLREDVRRRLEQGLSIASAGMLSEENRDGEALKERCNRIADAYWEGVRSYIQDMYRYVENDHAAFLVKLESSELEQRRNKLAEQIADDEIAAIAAKEDDYAA